MSCMVWNFEETLWDFMEYTWDAECIETDLLETLNATSYLLAKQPVALPDEPKVFVISDFPQDFDYAREAYSVVNSSINIPTVNDYSAGYMTRYFYRKAVDDLSPIREVNRDGYDLAQKNFIYKAVELRWKLIGKPENIKLLNEKSLLSVDVEFPGIYNKLKNNLLQYSKDIFEPETTFDVSDKFTDVVVPKSFINNQIEIIDSPDASGSYTPEIIPYMRVDENNIPTNNVSIAVIDEKIIRGTEEPIVNLTVKLASVNSSIPTEENYTAGYMPRYFFRISSNENSPVKETNLDEYNTLKTNFMYKSVEIQWKLTGEKDVVQLMNTNSVITADSIVKGIIALNLNPLQYYDTSIIIQNNSTITTFVSEDTINSSLRKLKKSVESLDIFARKDIVQSSLNENGVELTNENNEVLVDTNNVYHVPYLLKDDSMHSTQQSIQNKMTMKISKRNEDKAADFVKIYAEDKGSNFGTHQKHVSEIGVTGSL